ncbi:MAG TPA: PH domain-containing protein [Gammaproteobacteria bacterium]
MTETILYRAHPPMFRNNPFGFIVSVLLIGAAVGVLILLVWYVRTRSERLTITPEELRYERGILSRTHNEVRLSAIRSIRVRQSLFQRMFGTGDIDVFTAGDLPEVEVRGIPDPHEVRELVAEYS